MDPIGITSAIAAGNHVVSLLRGVADSVKSLGKAEVINQLIEAQLALMDLLQKHQELQTENHELKKKYQEVQELLSLLPKVEYHYEANWVRREDGSLDGPYSPQVWDTERKLVRMHFKERIQPFTAQKPTHLRFVCLKFEKFSSIPFEFMEKNKVWSEEELSARPPTREARRPPALHRPRVRP